MRRFLIPSLFTAVLLAACAKAPSAPEPTPASTSASPVAETETVTGIEETASELQEKIQLDDRDAMFRLGAMYHDGQGVTKDLTKARELFEAAGRLGERKSAYNLGIMYLKGEGIPADAVIAKRWFEKSSDLGNYRATYQLGLLSYQGKGTPKDLARAANLFRQAAQKSVAAAQCNYAIVLIRGEGVKADAVEAYAWLTLARENGCSSAADTLNKLIKQLTKEQIVQGEERAKILREAHTIPRSPVPTPR